MKSVCEIAGRMPEGRKFSDDNEERIALDTNIQKKAGR